MDILDSKGIEFTTRVSGFSNMVTEHGLNHFESRFNIEMWNFTRSLSVWIHIVLWTLIMGSFKNPPFS